MTVNGAPVSLSSTEYRLLALLVANRGRVLSFQEILDQVWGSEYRAEISYIHTYIWRLRRKIESDPKNPRFILNKLDLGYQFAPL